MPLRGAPLTLTRTLADQLAEDVQAGEPLEAAAGKRGIGVTTVYRWLQVGREDRDSWINDQPQPIRPDTASDCEYFWQRIVQARATLEARVARSALVATEEGTKDAAIRSKASLDWLGRHPSTRQRWGLQVQVEHTGSVDHRLQQLATLPPTDLLALASPELRALVDDEPPSA
jgi:hypothetical protein